MRFHRRYYESIKSSDGRVLKSRREMREVFPVHFHDRFARLLDLPVREFRGYFPDFLHLQEVKVAGL